MHAIDKTASSISDHETMSYVHKPPVSEFTIFDHPDCDLVRCARPLCEDGVPLVTPSGQCCPVCDPTTAEPETKQPEETEQPETLPPVNTEPATSSEPATEKPCQVKGALLVKCASGCPATCLNPSVSCFVMICDVPGLCECPAGQVVDQVNNRCVPLEECPSAAGTAYHIGCVGNR